MKIIKEFQPYINPEMNQPRTCLWLTPEAIDELIILNKLNNAIKDNSEIQCGFTGINKEILLITFPQNSINK